MWWLILKQEPRFTSLNEPVFLGIDVGTSSVKAGFVSQSGKGLRQVSVEYPTNFGVDGQVEQDPWDWWKAATQAVQTLAAQSPQCAQQVQALAVSCQAPTLFGVDDDGQPVGRGLIWMDRRSDGICRDTLSEHGAYINQYSCNRIDPYYMLSKLTWQKRYEAEQYHKTTCYLQINGWIVYQLTGVRQIDVTNANLTQLMNVHSLTWDEGIFQRLQLDIRKMPPIVPCDSVVGKIRPEMAELWGISPDAVVAAGCVDGSSVPYGLQLWQEGEVFEMSGTSSGIGVILSEPSFSPNLSLMKHVQPGKWFLKGSTSCSGGSLKWYRDQVDGRSDGAAFEEFSRLAEQSVAGAGGVLFLPYLNGERAPLWDSALRGVMLGFGSATEKKDLLRAIMEGTAYALRTILEEFPSDRLQTEMILGTGGGYQSRIWSQIKADVLERPICAKKLAFDAAVMGCAYVAMKALQIPIPEKEAAEEVVYHPDQATAAAYRRQYKRFCTLYRATKELFHEEEPSC